MTEPKLSPTAILLLSLVYFFGGISSLSALILSVAVHELGHIAAIGLASGKLKGIKIDASGICISCVGLQSRAAMLAALLAGPLFGLLLAYGASYFGNIHSNTLLLKTAGYSLILSLYNLLPALPLDGGQALSCVLGAVFPRADTGRIMLYLSIFVGLTLLTLGIVCIRRAYGTAFAIAGIMLLTVQRGIVKSHGLL